MVECATILSLDLQSKIFTPEFSKAGWRSVIKQGRYAKMYGVFILLNLRAVRELPAAWRFGESPSGLQEAHGSFS